MGSDPNPARSPLRPGWTTGRPTHQARESTALCLTSRMDFLTDLRASVRTLRTHTSYALTAIVTLALGVGATTAMFSALYAVLLAPQPIRDQNRLVVGWGLEPQRSHGLVE